MKRRTLKNGLRLPATTAVLILFSLACSLLTGETPESIESIQGMASTALAGDGSAPADRPTPSEKPEALVVVKQGYSQDGDRVNFGLLVRNPNREFAVERATYLAAAYDSDGVVLTSETGFVYLILPDQTLGVVGSITLPEGQTAATLEIKLTGGEYAPSVMVAPVTAEKISFVIDGYNSRATGLLANPNDRVLFNPSVTAIAMDETGGIIGGGKGYVNFIPAGGSTGVQVSLTVPKTVRVDAVELYTMVSGAISLDSPEAPEGALPISIDKSGFGQAAGSVGYGMILHNPNAGLVIRDSQYRLTFFDADGNVLAATDGELGLGVQLLPDQTLGVAGTKSLGAGENVDHILFQVTPGEYAAMGAMPFFSAEKVQFVPDSMFPEVTGIIVNPFERDFTNMLVAAIAYDASGAIIGGGYGYLLFLPSSGRAAVEARMTTAGNPDAVELYVLLRDLDSFLK